MKKHLQRAMSFLLACALLLSLTPVTMITAHAHETDAEAATQSVDDGTMNLRYDDHVDMTGKTVEIIDAGTPVSYQVGYGVEVNKVLDTAVVTLEGDTLVATGVGTAQVKIDGEVRNIKVTAAPISMLLLLGQSNMQGSEGNANQSIICEDGQVYSTYGDRYSMNTSNATNFAPSALTGAGSLLNVNGTTAKLKDWPVYLLNEAGAGKAGPDSGFGYEWAKQTGEKVWVVNAAHGGSAISTWQKTGANYKEAVLLFKACQDTLRKEIAAGHFTLSHMGYFWCQGCSDAGKTAEWYVDMFLTMHENLKKELAFSEDKTFEFAGIIPVRAGNETSASYRVGEYKDTTTASYYESFKDLRFNGPRVAQYWMANNPELPDIWNVCNIGEEWVYMPDGTHGVKAYFQANYPNGKVDYRPQVAQKTSWYTPTTPKAVHDSIHYNQIGYNEVGREAARNALIMLGEIEAPEVETSVRFLTWDGYTAADSIEAATVGSSATLVVPMVSPVWKTKEVRYELTPGLKWDYYDLLATNRWTSGALIAVDKNVAVEVVESTEVTNYKWQMNADGTGLECVTGDNYAENALTLAEGTVENGVLQGVRYAVTQPIELAHHKQWFVEFEASGDWSGMLLSTSDTSKSAGNQYFVKTGAQMSLGRYDNTPAAQNFWMDVSIDATKNTVYRLENRVTLDENGEYVSNMVYLLIDGVEVGPVNDGSAANYISGMDLKFSYIGSSNTQVLSNLKLNYLRVEIVHTHDFSIEKNSVTGTCVDKNYTVWACECGETTKVYGEEYGDHRFGLWQVDNGECFRECEWCEAFETALHVWQMNEDGTALLDIANGGTAMVPVKGSVANGVLTNIQYALAEKVTLDADKEWVIEFEGSGNWKGMLLSKEATSTKSGNQYFFRNTSSGLSLGYYKGSSAKNFWMKPTLDTAKDTVYRLENRVTVDDAGNTTNMVYLLIDGVEYGPVNGGTGTNYVSGTDLTFNYIGGKTTQYVNGLALKYLLINIPSAHVHAYTVEKETVAGTCVESGYVIWACECGETTKVEDGQYGDHVHGEWTSADGVITRSCTVCNTVLQTATYVWQMNEDGTALLDIANGGTAMVPVKGSVANGVLTNIQYALAEKVTLDADKEWVIEFEGSGNWKGMLLSKEATSTKSGNQYFFRNTSSGLSLGYYKGSSAKNFWMKPTLDTAKDTVYRLENRVTVDDAGNTTNMVYLLIDGVEYGPVNGGTGTNYVSGTDLTFNYIGGKTTQYVNGLSLKYLLINIPSADVHVHDYAIEKESVAGTCVEKGYVIWACECGETTKVEKDQFGNHAFGSWYVENGVCRRDCKYCEAYETEELLAYRWEMNEDGTALVSVATDNVYVENALTKSAGTVANGILTNTSHKIAKPVKLMHDDEWVIEWKSNGNWTGMLFSRDSTPRTAGNQYLFTSSGGSLALGYYNESLSAKNSVYGDTSGYTTSTVFRLENRVTVDAEGNWVSNEVYVLIDGTEVGTMNAVGQYPDGTDLTFNHIGALSTQKLNNLALEYLQIQVPHSHDYVTEQETVPGSCTQSGYVVWACECGATNNVPNGQYGSHVYGEWYAADGVHRRDCKDCDVYEIDEHLDYRWEMNEAGTGLVSVTTNGSRENALTLELGSVESGVLQGVRYAMDKRVDLTHNVEWVVEWQASGVWTGMLLSKNKVSNSTGNLYFFRAAGGSMSLGHYDESQKAHNNPITIADFDTARDYTFRLENRVTVDKDGKYVSNMVYLVVDDIEIAAISKENTDNYTSGTDLTFNYMGSSGNQVLKNMALKYLQIWINGTEEHKHAYHVSESDPGNCQTEGQNTYLCSCGDTYSASTGKLGEHIYSSWRIEGEYRLRSCTLCDASQTVLLGTHYDDSISNNYYTTISKKDYVLCEGVTESEVVINNGSGNRRQVLHVIEVDPYNTNIEVLPGYYGIDQDLTDTNNWITKPTQVTMDYYRDVMGYNVVAGMNTALSYTSNAPFSFMVMNGQVLADRGQGFRDGGDSYLAVIKNNDGTVTFELRGENDPLQGNEWQAIACSFGFTVKNGQLTSTSTDRGSGDDRSMIGIKADGTLVIVQAEGRNAPYSSGLTQYELGETMLALGCVWAVNGDGGGSSQIVTKREGENDYTLRNIPSDGTARATTMSILVVSKAKADGVFDHVSMLAENEYITPNGSVSIAVKGVDGAGMAADLPENITYEATGGRFADGIFTSDGTLGEQTVTAYRNGEAVGSVTVNVVIPTSISYDNAALAVPYGKSVDIPISAYYGSFVVALSGADIEFKMSEEIGTINGLIFTAPAEADAGEINKADLTATLVLNPELTAVIPVYVGKGSEVLYDFEDQDTHGFVRSTVSQYNAIKVGGSTYIVDSNTGHVHNGDYAMAVELDFSNSIEPGFLLGTLTYSNKVVLENAQTIGMWVYFPDEADGLRIDTQVPYYVSKNLQVALGYLTPAASVSEGGETDIAEVGFINAYDESGWHYISVDVSSQEFTGLPILKFYVSMKEGKNGYVYGEQLNVNGKYVLYVDDITVDYSQVVDDREAPSFLDLTYQTPSMDTAKPLKGDTVGSSTVSFSATVVENTKKNNYSGIDPTSKRVYIDGVDYTERLTISEGEQVTLTLSDVSLPAGMHTVKFVICDNMGNRSAISRDIIVGSADAANVKVVARDPHAERILMGSLYYIDVVADDPETISSVTVTLDLNNISVWQLDHMEVAKGFRANYSLIWDENIATVTISADGKTDLSGEDQVILSIPIRTWELPIVEPIYGHNGEIYMYDDYKATNSIIPMGLYVEIDSITVRYRNGAGTHYTGSRIEVTTELSGNADTTADSASMNYIGDEPWYADWNGGHDHRPETKQYYDENATNHVDAITLADQAPTCTKAGYTGRTYCEVCQSVVDWGTTVEKTGHSYAFVDNVLKCECGDLFNGVYTDGKTYIDGVVSDVNGWFGESYVQDGTTLTGIHKVPSPEDASVEYYYDFGEDGICKDHMKYTGMFRDGDVNRFAYLGELASGWQTVDGDWYYFSPETLANVSGTYKVDGLAFEFDENGKITSGVWVESEQGRRYWYGPSYCDDRWYEIDGEWYYFKNGYCITGVHFSVAPNQTELNRWYDFGEDGVAVPFGTGFYTLEDGRVIYVVDGYATAGLHKVGEDYYCCSYDGGIVRNKVHYAYETHCDLPCDNYAFGEDGKMLQGLVQKSDGLYYYVNGKVGTAGLTKINGDYYFVRSSGKCATGEYYAYATNCDLPCGTYVFGADGKMIDPPAVEPEKPDTPDTTVKNGIVMEADGVYYYVDGKPGPAGLTKVGNDYYFVRSNGKCATGGYYAYATNCDLPCDNYEFGKDGKMLQGLVQKDDGLYYYVNGKYGPAGLTKIGRDYYFVSSSGKCATGQKYAWATNCDLPCGDYEFAENGKLIKNGFFVEEDGIYYYVDGEIAPAGLTKVGEDYYFISSSGKCSTGSKYAYTTNCDLPCDTYEFGADGKMLRGLVQKDDGLYYYVNGKVGTAGLTKINGDYYFVRSSGKCATGEYYAYATNCDLPCGNYTFGEDGKMIDPPAVGPEDPDIPDTTVKNGIVEEADGIYYYVDGKRGPAGLTKVGEDYYFVSSSGKCSTGSKYAYATNCDLPCDTYEFGKDGKMLQGLVQKDDGLYYYVNGKYGPAGLTEIDGDYYFVSSSGKCATGEKYAWATNCDLPCGNYTFGEDGKMMDPPADEPEVPTEPEKPSEPEEPEIKNGIVEEADGVYYYVDGKLGPAGLTKVGEDYYFVSSSGKCSTGSKYAYATNCDLPCDTYEFGKDGKMLQGLVQKDDGLYYYVNGKYGPAGLTEIGGDYYFVSSSGKCATGEKYAWATNCDLPCGNYTFGEDGKMIDPPAMTYERYINMTAEEQAAFRGTFESTEAFFQWYNAARAEYDKQNPGLDVGDGSVDMGDLV